MLRMLTGLVMSPVTAALKALPLGRRNRSRQRVRRFRAKLAAEAMQERSSDFVTESPPYTTVLVRRDLLSLAGIERRESWEVRITGEDVSIKLDDSIWIDFNRDEANRLAGFLTSPPRTDSYAFCSRYDGRKVTCIWHGTTDRTIVFTEEWSGEHGTAKLTKQSATALAKVIRRM